MSTILNFFRSKRNLFFASLLWILLWAVPWGELPTFQENLYLAFFTDMIRLGIAIGMFIAPGVLLYLLLRNHNDPIHNRAGIIPIGFALSVSMIAAFGLIGRLAGFSFSLVRTVFALVGMGELIFLYFLKPGFAIRREHFLGIFRGLFENILLLLALILAISMTFNGYQFFIDDTTYAAYAMNWQYSTHLGFNTIVHHTTVIEHSRFWLALYPMVQALLSDLSGVPVILLFSNYLELFLVPLAVVTAYWFARVLGFSHKAAGVSVFIQMLLYTMMIDEAWPVGFWFFQNMSEDKVSAVFLLAPVFFVFVLVFLQFPAIRTGALVLIAGVGLMLTHPVILFLSCVIAGGLGLFSVWMKKTAWLPVLQLAMIIVAVMLPYLAVRLSDHPSQASITYDAESVSATFQAERYVHVVSDRFYGLNPDVLKLLNIPPESDFYSSFQVFRLIPVALVLFTLILAFFKLRDGELYWGYIMVCALLVAFATIPYTGWILGYFISARMLPRVSWFSPMGLAGALLTTFLFERMKSNKMHEKFVKSPAMNARQLDSTTKGFMVELMFTAIMLVSVLFPRAAAYFEVLDGNKQLAQIGEYIDQHAEIVVTSIALDYTTTQLLPSVSTQTSLISFREEKEYNPHNYFLSIDEIQERMDASNTIRSLDLSIPADERCRLLDKYRVRFILAGSNNADQYGQLLTVCEKRAIVVFLTQDVILLEYR